MIECAVTGGGVAGLSAAVRLAAEGVAVTLVEARPRAGGRAYGFADAESGATLDNGQHIMMGCYTEMLAYLDAIGTRNLLTPITRMRVPFVSPGGATVELKAAAIPYPLDALSAFMGFKALTFGQRLALLRVVLKAALTPRDSMLELDRITVEEWLSSCGQSKEAITYLWEPIVLATMNAKIHEASAFLFMVVLKEAFLAGKQASTFLVPSLDLSALLVDPALAFIRRNGGRVLLHTPVERIEKREDGFLLHSPAGIIEAASVVLALPPRAFAKLAVESPALAAMNIDTDAFIPSLIISAHVWSKKAITAETMSGFHGTAIQWIFPHGVSADGTRRYAVVISAANHLAEVSNGELESTVRSELCALYPQLAREELVRIKLVRETAATFLPLPGLEAVRPRPGSPGGGLFLAGDWTAVSLPATLEGAVRSGHLAAKAALSYLKSGK